MLDGNHLNELPDFTAASALTDLSVTNNPLSDQALGVLQELEARGVSVFSRPLSPATYFVRPPSQSR